MTGIWTRQAVLSALAVITLALPRSRPFYDPLANPLADASYNFDFQEEGHARSEQSDSRGNVIGSYSFIGDDGLTRTYTYRAGSGTGFVITGDDLPQDSNTVAVPVGSLPSASSPAAQALQYSALSTRPSPRRPVEEARVRSSGAPGAGHNFQYRTLSHSREESADNRNEVEGNFGFVADDGRRRTVKYEASSATGFTVEGSHLPVGPEVPGARSGRPTGKLDPVPRANFVDPLADPFADASYNFSFDSERYSRSETSDGKGNVQGTYTVVDDDGTRRTFSFRAGEGIGFESKQISQTRGPRPSPL